MKTEFDQALEVIIQHCDEIKKPDLLYDKMQQLKIAAEIVKDALYELRNFE